MEEAEVKFGRRLLRGKGEDDRLRELEGRLKELQVEQGKRRGGGRKKEGIENGGGDLMRCLSNAGKQERAG